MRLTRFTDYSLRTLVYLAQNTKGRVTIGEISEVYDISKNHLMKVVSNLTRMGVVAAQRGPGGGVRLNRAAADISLAEIVGNTEKCLQDMDVTGQSPAADTDQKLQDCLKLALQAYLSELERFTLADLLEPLDFAPIKAKLSEKAA
ncbi:MAG: Rrf2 family transcriptional regulator [Lysobacterales bacterium]|jgi:Rrf2 family nitric oxide-sensitive transcriptional repressor